MNSTLKRAVQRALMVLSVAAGGAGLAVAHHSAAVFDASTQKVIAGTVKKFDWTNPHSYFFLDVKDDKGKVANWKLEGYPPSVLSR